MIDDRVDGSDPAWSWQPSSIVRRRLNTNPGDSEPVHGSRSIQEHGVPQVLSPPSSQVEAMGGSVEGASILGSMSRSTVKIPTRGVATLEALSGPSDVPAGSAEVFMKLDREVARGRVLVVEDTAAIRKIVGYHISSAGYEVGFAENGEAAVQAACDAPYDLILMDVQMPIMDGLEATRMLREQGLSIPIIALTAHASTFDRDLCLSVGCTDFLTKPISRDELIRAIERHLRFVAEA